MRAERVVITAPGRVELEAVEVEEPGPGEVAVRTRLSLLSSGTERVCFRGSFDEPSHWSRWVRYPFTPGYSAVGEVVAAGAGVPELAPGERVAIRRPHQSASVVRAESAYPVPDGVSDEAAAFFALSAIAQHGVREARPVLGELAGIAGLGPLGQLVARYAALAGNEVLAIGTNATRLATAARHGATAVAERAEAASDPVRELTGGAGLDAAYDVTGSPGVLASLAGLTRVGGSVVLVGDTPWPSEQALGGDVLRRGLRVIGVHDSGIVRAARSDDRRWTFAENVGLFFRLVEQGRLPVDDLVTHRFDAADAAGAYAALDDAHALGVVLRWGGGA